MRTRISCYAEKFIESGWLAALIIVPLLFNSYSERGFEEDKLPFFRSIVILMTGAGLVWMIERGREVLTENGRSIWRAPLILPWGLMIGVYILSTLFSIAPEVSFWGDYVRRQGTYTHLSYMLLFALIVLTLRSSRQIDRILTVMAITSFPVAGYGIIQHFGLDPVVWSGADFQSRVPSTAGNPIFMAAYLCMVAPLTLALTLDRMGKALAVRTQSGSSPRYVASCISALAYLLLLIVQILAIAFSESRGPVVGLLAGLFVFALLLCLQHGGRVRRITFILLIAGTVGTLSIIALARLPQSPLQKLPHIARLSTILETGSGSGRVRILIWQGVTELLKASPSRLLLGYGPETLYFVYPPYYPPELGQIEDRNKLPDRSHNETLDSLVTLGLMGLATQLFLFGSVFYYIIKWLGLIQTRGRRRLFIAFCLTGIALGIALPYLVQQRLTLAAIGIPAGLVIGVVVYLLFCGAVFPKNQTIQHPHRLLLAALLSAILAHFIEIQVGIANSLTISYFWVYAALALVAGMPLLRPAEALPEQSKVAVVEVRRKKKLKEKEKKKEIQQRTQPPAYSRNPTLLCLTLMMSLVLPVLVFDFIIPEFRFNERTFPVVALFTLTWLVGGVLITSQAAMEGSGDNSGGWTNHLSYYVSISLLLSCGYIVFHIPWVRMKAPVESVTSAQLLIDLETHRANALTILYAWSLLVMVGSTLLLKTGRYQILQLTRSHLAVLCYPILILLLLPLIVGTNLSISLADMYQKRAMACMTLEKWDGAVILFEKALEVQPRQDAYCLKLADAYLVKAQAEPQQRDALMKAALSQLNRAREINPRNPKYIHRLAKLHDAWARITTDPDERLRQLKLADQKYSEAVAHFPNSVIIWNEWAKISLDQKDFEKAIERIKHSLQLDPLFAYTYTLLGFAHIEHKEWEAARRTCLKATELEPGNIEHWSTLALALTHLGETNEAIRANLKVLEIKPDDPITHANLALLYARTGDVEQALASAEHAVRLAPPQDRPAIENWMKELKQRRQSEPMIR